MKITRSAHILKGLRIMLAVLCMSQLITNRPVSAAPTAVTGPGITVDAEIGQHLISPDIYGLNFATESFAQELALPLRRWGGNGTSKYNWQTANTNTALDWYFENVSNYNPVSGAAETHLQWIDQNIRTATRSLLTIPMLGYVAKNNSSCSYSISKYGAQQDSDAAWRPDCGNGTTPGGSPLTGNTPTDASQAVDVNFMKGWVQSLVTKYGSAATTGVRYYALDNEPDLWGDTHRDVHPSPQSYDELFSKSIAYGEAIKSADPAARLLGYSSFGWTGYWYSELDTVTAAANGYTYFPDYQSHGSKYQVEWYLAKMKEYEQLNNKRLLDVLDLHYYPSAGTSLNTAGDAARQAKRLRTTRSLWDATYTDESWIGGSDQPLDWRVVRLLPRMRTWVNTNYPGTGLAITEYNFGGLEHINGALAQADVLGIFGRESLDMAALWNYPDSALGYDHFETLPGAYAFRMYRNYDGLGGKFGATSISAVSADQAQLAVYAAKRATDGALTVMVINKSSQAQVSALQLKNFLPAATAKVYQYSAANLGAIVRKPDQVVTSSGFSAEFPANSITLVVLAAASSANPGNCALFPTNNIWNARVDSLPVHARSTDWINSIGRSSGFHMDFGSGTWNGGLIGIPVNIVDGTVSKASVDFYYPDESDAGPYPIPASPKIEYGSDHHILIVDSSTCKLYEIYDASYSAGNWSGGSGAIWSLGSNALRPDTWTSADAAGLPILPGLVRYEEMLTGSINHALRFTAAQTNRYIWPARHLTSNDATAPQIPPMGARFRLKSSFNISVYSAEMQVILKAMKQYGIILADNGSNWYVSGAPDERWNNDMLHTLDVLTGDDFEAVDSSVLMADPNSGAVKPVNVTISGNTGAAGVTLTYVSGVQKTVLSDVSGNYRISVPYNWSGKITPTKSGVISFSPAFRSYSAIKNSPIGQNFRVNHLAIFVSNAGQDGFLRESSETSGVAGLLNSTSGTFLIGDDTSRRQTMGMLSFNTAALPDTAVLTSVRVKLTFQGMVGTNPFSTHGGLVMDIRQPNFGSSAGLSFDDFSAVAGLRSAGSIGKLPVNGVYSGLLSAAAFAYINRTGTTQLRLRFQLDDDNDAIADRLAFYSGDALNTAYRPVLAIVYYLP